MADPGALRDNPNDVSIVTFGANYDLRRREARLSLDVMWVVNPLNREDFNRHPIEVTGITGLGLLRDMGDNDDQIVLRWQFQLIF